MFYQIKTQKSEGKAALIHHRSSVRLQPTIIFIINRFDNYFFNNRLIVQYINCQKLVKPKLKYSDGLFCLTSSQKDVEFTIKEN